MCCPRTHLSNPCTWTFEAPHIRFKGFRQYHLELILIPGPYHHFVVLTVKSCFFLCKNLSNGSVSWRTYSCLHTFGARNERGSQSRKYLLECVPDQSLFWFVRRVSISTTMDSTFKSLAIKRVCFGILFYNNILHIRILLFPFRNHFLLYM